MKKNFLGDADKYGAALFWSLTVMFFDGFTEMALTVDTLPIFYIQRDQLMYPVRPTAARCYANAWRAPSWQLQLLFCSCLAAFLSPEAPA